MCQSCATVAVLLARFISASSPPSFYALEHIRGRIFAETQRPTPQFKLR